MKIIVPLDGPDYFENDSQYNIQGDEYKKMLQCLKKLSNDSRLLKILNDEEVAVYERIFFEVISSKGKKKFFGKLSSHHKFFRVQDVDEYLQIKCEINSKFIYFDKLSFEIEANRILKRVCFLLNITYKGPFRTNSGLVYGNGRFCGKTDHIQHMFNQSYGIALKSGWPRLNELDISQTLDWFLLYNIPLDKISSCPVSKAINALTYLINDHYLESDAAVLFWAMVGIEAIYAKGSDGIQNQINIKTSLVFGEPQQYKKKLTKLYNYRSRLIHGDINFPPKYKKDVVEEYDLEYWDNCAFASSILIATIRELISKNKTEFIFNYSLINE